VVVPWPCMVTQVLIPGMDTEEDMEEEDTEEDMEDTEEEDTEEEDMEEDTVEAVTVMMRGVTCLPMV